MVPRRGLLHFLRLACSLFHFLRLALGNRPADDARHAAAQTPGTSRSCTRTGNKTAPVNHLLGQLLLQKFHLCLGGAKVYLLVGCECQQATPTRAASGVRPRARTRATTDGASAASPWRERDLPRFRGTQARDHLHKRLGARRTCTCRASDFAASSALLQAMACCICRCRSLSSCCRAARDARHAAVRRAERPRARGAAAARRTARL